MIRKVLISTMFAGILTQASGVLAANYNSGAVRNSPQSAYTNVEFGSGWYLRGDISWNMGGRSEAGTQFIGDLGDTLDFDYDDALAVRIGVGFQYSPSLRFDFTAEQSLDSEFDGTFNVNVDGLLLTTLPDGSTVFVPVNNIFGIETVDAEYDAQNFMMNAYYDFPKFGRFTPYVGAGVGVSRIHYSEVRSLSCLPTATEACGAPLPGAIGVAVPDTVILSDDETAYALAYQLMAGTAYDITDVFKFDVGYSIFTTGDGPTLNYDDGTAINVDGFSVHKITVGLRYELW